jgi:hypothetical protein
MNWRPIFETMLAIEVIVLGVSIHSNGFLYSGSDLPKEVMEVPKL